MEQGMRALKKIKQNVTRKWRMKKSMKVVKKTKQVVRRKKGELNRS